MTVSISGSTGISANAHGFLVGQIAQFGQTTAPSGFLKCNGAAVSRVTYASLFAVIGTTYGAGDGSNTFNVPEVRGEFLRCLDDGRGIDTGRVIGSAQTHSMQDHTHGAWPIVASSAVAGAGYSAVTSGGGKTDPTGAVSSGSVGTETRPRNVAFLCCIFSGV